MRPSVYIIVLNWYNWWDTVACLDSLFKSSYERINIILIDNDSQNDSVPQLAAYFKDQFKKGILEEGGGMAPEMLREGIRIETSARMTGVDANDMNSGNVLFLVSDVNLGFARGCNVGIELAMKAGSDLIYLLNSDAVVREDSIKRIVNAFDTVDERTVVLGPLIYDFPVEGEINTIQTAGGIFDWDRFPCYAVKRSGEVEKEPRPGISPCDWISGAAMVIDVRRSPLKCLNERYYFGCDDVEFCYALSKLGYSVAIVEDAVVWHKLGTARAVFNKKAVFKYVRNLQSNLKFNLNNNPYILKKGLVYTSQIIITLIVFAFPGLNARTKGFKKD